jgi:hypothetical protein
MLVCAILLGLLGTESATAQCRRGERCWPWQRRGHAAPVEFGVRGGYDFDDGVGSAGAQFRIPLVRQLPLVPSGDVYFGDSLTDWQVNVDLMAVPDELGGLYAGVGAAFVDRDFDLADDHEVRAGYNLVAGIDGRQLFDTRIRPFAEARWTHVDEYDPFRLVAGINVPVR